MVNETAVSRELTAPEFRICPHLGLRDDPGTQAAYPRLDHVCARRPSSDLSTEWQTQYCLNGQYQGCPHFQREIKEQPWHGGRFDLQRFGWRWEFVLIGLMMLIGAGATIIGVMLATSPGGS